MSNITTYYAARKNPFVWLAALLSIVAAVARIVFAARTGGLDFTDVVVRIILPAAANLAIAIRLPWRGEKQFYVTVVPVVLLTLYLCVAGVSISGSVPMTALCIIVSLVFAALYCLTFMGKLNSKLLALICHNTFLNHNCKFLILVKMNLLIQHHSVISRKSEGLRYGCHLLSVRRIFKAVL